MFDTFREFMFGSVYKNVKAKGEERKIYGILNGIFKHYLEFPDEMPEEYRRIAEQDGLHRAVCDYVSGMTDKYAMCQYSELYIPEAWQVR